MVSLKKLFDEYVKNNTISGSPPPNLLSKVKSLDERKLYSLFDDVIKRFINIRMRLEKVRDSLLILRKTARSLGKPVKDINNSLKIVYFYLYGFRPSVDVNILGNVKIKPVKGSHMIKLVVPWKYGSYILNKNDVKKDKLFNADTVINGHNNEFVGGLAKRGSTSYVKFGLGTNELLAKINSLITKIKDPNSSDDVVKDSFMKLVLIVREMIAFCDAATGSWLQMIGSFLTQISSKHLEVESKKRLLRIIDLIKNSKVVGKDIIKVDNIVKKGFITLIRNGQRYDWSVIGLPITLSNPLKNELDKNLNDYNGFKMSDDLGLINSSLKGYRVVHFTNFTTEMSGFSDFIKEFSIKTGGGLSNVSINNDSVLILPFAVNGESILVDNKFNPHYDKVLTNSFKSLCPNYAKLIWDALKNKSVETVFNDGGVITVHLDDLSNVAKEVAFSKAINGKDKQKIQLIPLRLSSVKEIIMKNGYSEDQFNLMINSIFECNDGVCTSETLNELGVDTANKNDLFLALFKKDGDGFSLLTKLKDRRISVDDVEFMMILSKNYSGADFKGNYDTYLDNIVNEY